VTFPAQDLRWRRDNLSSPNAFAFAFPPLFVILSELRLLQLRRIPATRIAN
jgi:hypothetical protein